MTFGNQVDLGMFGTNIKADNFRASVAPELATLAVLGLGAVARCAADDESTHAPSCE